MFQGEQGLSGAHGIAGPPGRKVSTSPCYFPVLVAVWDPLYVVCVVSVY